jgi:hypothetical protein
MSARWRMNSRLTSMLAALSISEESINDCKRHILEFLETPMTDEQLVEVYSASVFRTAAPQSPSGIRSRRAALTELGLVKEVGYGKTRSGRKAIIWQVADVQN